MSLIVALWEIQIEGKYGWAENLPTWKIEDGRIVDLLGKSITGYHVGLNAFVLAMYHYPFIVGLSSWSLAKELLTIGFGYCWLFLIEDFLWFILNPHYGWKKFRMKSEGIPWHKNWIGPVPDFYWLFSILGTALIIISQQM